jgi:hypothetical protein
MLNKNINIEHLIKRLEKSVAFAEKEGENMHDVSWGMQEGILISYNEAKAVIEALKAFKISSNPMLADSAVFSKEQVIRIVAEFGRTYNTEAFLGNGETLEQAIEEVKDLIKWDA